MRAIGIGVLLLSGCAGVWHSPSAPPAQVACRDQAHCDRVWQKTQLGISQTSGYRIRLANDTVIETFGPMRNGSGVAYQALRSNNADGSGTIVVRAICHATVYGCIDDPARYNRTIEEALQTVE